MKLQHTQHTGKYSAAVAEAYPLGELSICIHMPSMLSDMPDERYMGCYTEIPSDPDLPTILWGPTEGRSVDECVTSCGNQGFTYSGNTACSHNFAQLGTNTIYYLLPIGDTPGKYHTTLKKNNGLPKGQRT